MSTLPEHIKELRKADRDVGKMDPRWQLLACTTIAAHLSEIEEALELLMGVLRESHKIARKAGTGRPASTDGLWASVGDIQRYLVRVDGDKWRFKDLDKEEAT